MALAMLKSSFYFCIYPHCPAKIQPATYQNSLKRQSIFKVNSVNLQSNFSEFAE